MTVLTMASASGIDMARFVARLVEPGDEPELLLTFPSVAKSYADDLKRVLERVYAAGKEAGAEETKDDD